MKATARRDTTPSCETCGWAGKTTTATMAADSMRKHSCARWLDQAAKTGRRLERDAAVDRAPQEALALAYDPAVNGYALAADPRCLWGWKRCDCSFGHACFRPLGHKGRCRDGLTPRWPCEYSQRPKDWDSKGRAEANT